MGGNLREKRKLAKLTQIGLAEKSGISRATIANIESGFYRETDTATLGFLARALGCTPSDLLAGIPPKRRKKPRRTS